MDREEFKKKMRSNDTAASKLEVKKVIGDILKSETPGTNCVICMEELADVYICLEMLKKMFNYSSDEISRAVEIKLDRFERRTEKHE